jgi:hypothetical protein
VNHDELELKLSRANAVAFAAAALVQAIRADDKGGYHLLHPLWRPSRVAFDTLQAALERWRKVGGSG